ncbi:MAG: hypothetical protein AAGG38_06210 [Planctomycetota bacterium]
MATKYKLTYFAARRRWKKKHRGKVYYLGPVDVVKSNREAYDTALKEWREIERGLEAEDDQAELDRVRAENEDLLAMVEAAREDPTNTIQNDLAAAVIKQRGIAGHPDFKIGNSGPDDMQVQVETFVESHHARHRNNELSAGRFDQLRRDADYFGAWATDRGIRPSTVNAAAVEDYFNHVMELVARGSISRAYARGRWVTFRMFVKWLWEREICNLPRNLEARRFKISIPTKKIKTYPLDDLHEVMAAASDKTKLYLLLMLNIGGYQSDLSDLHPSEVKLGKNPRITRKRSKTAEASQDVPEVSYPLWPETARLLKAYRSKDSERWLTNESGKPLRIDHIGEDGKLQRLDAIRSAVRRVYLKINRARKKAGEQPMPTHDLKLLRKTGADAITQNSEFGGRTADLYLGHSPRSMREKHYSNAEQGQLDAAVVWLGSHLGCA